MHSLLTRFKTSKVLTAAIAALFAAGGAHAEETCASLLVVYGTTEMWWCSLIGPYGNSCFYSCVRMARWIILDY
jgi:hypothetical protein